MSDAPARILETLTTPRTLPELLDEVMLPDLAVLEALAVLLEQGLVRRIASSAVRVELADPERMAVLAALAKRRRCLTVPTSRSIQRPSVWCPIRTSVRPT